MQKQMAQLLKGYLPPDPGGKTAVLPVSQAFRAERCLNTVMAKWPFSSPVQVQAVRTLSGDLWVRCQTYVKVGTRYRPVLIFDDAEPCGQMSYRDLLCMMCALVSEIESELDSLRQEGVEIATPADFEATWTTPV